MSATHQPRKRFGQNFLHDQIVIQQIIQSIHPEPSDHIVEIGPGLGALTRQLLPIVKTMDVVELDRDLIPKLEKTCQSLGMLNIHQADALKFDFKKLVTDNQPLRIVGNLPYNISTPLLFHLLESTDSIKDMHFMLQKEVVDRINAKPNSKAYGRLSIMLQYHCETEALFDVAPESFTPAPAVNSAVIRLTPLDSPVLAAKNIEYLSKVVATAFNQRRKTIRKSLSALVTEQQWLELGIDNQQRPEHLSVVDFVKISNYN